jgi:hypothetical protein
MARPYVPGAGWLHSRTLAKVFQLICQPDCQSLASVHKLKRLCCFALIYRSAQSAVPSGITRGAESVELAVLLSQLPAVLNYHKLQTSVKKKSMRWFNAGAALAAPLLEHFIKVSRQFALTQ